jgi:hypothetical protein
MSPGRAGHRPALALELPGRLDDRVRVDDQVGGDLLDCRHLVHDLQVRRDPGEPSSRNWNIILLLS